MEKEVVKKARLKAARYCTYRERSSKEVYDKLKTFGVTGIDADQIVKQLVSEGYLDDRRFSEQYIHGKITLKKWGRIKVVYGLRSKGISESIVMEVMQSVDEENYRSTLYELTKKKLALDTKSDLLKKKSKLVRYLGSKGYESELIWKAINDLMD